MTRINTNSKRIEIVLFERERVVVRAASLRCPVCDAERIPIVMKDRSLRRFAVDLGISAILAITILALLGAAAHRTETVRERARLEPVITGIRDGFGSEVVLAREGAGGPDARASVDSAVRFIAARSDLALDPAIATRVAALEERTLRGETRRLAPDDVAAVLSTTLLERVRDCTDDEIEHAADAFGNVMHLVPVDGFATSEEARDAGAAVAKRMRGVRQGELAGGSEVAVARARNGVTLRADARGKMTAEEFVDKVKTLRANLQVPQFYAVAMGSAREAVREDLNQRLALFGEALPAAWGTAESEGLTPVQVLLVAYSAASDDSLNFPTPELRRISADHVERYLERARNAPPVAPRRAAFGLYGDLFSSPLDLAFDRPTLTRLLDRVEERSAR